MDNEESVIIPEHKSLMLSSKASAPHLPFTFCYALHLMHGAFETSVSDPRAGLGVNLWGAQTGHTLLYIYRNPCQECGAL